MTYNSDICRTTSVSGVGDQTRDSYIALYNAENIMANIVKITANSYRKVFPHLVISFLFFLFIVFLIISYYDIMVNQDDDINT